MQNYFCEHEVPLKDSYCRIFGLQKKEERGAKRNDQAYATHSYNFKGLKFTHLIVT